MSALFKEILRNSRCSLHAEFNKFAGPHLMKSFQASFTEGDSERVKIAFDGSEWEVRYEAVDAGRDCVDLTARFRLAAGQCPGSNVAIRFEFGRWSKDNYVLMPAAAYNGNRFLSKKFSYPPQVREPEEMGVNAPEIITDVPRLNIGDGPSEIQLLTRDLSTPGIGFFDPAAQKGCWLLTTQKAIFKKAKSAKKDFGFGVTKTNFDDSGIRIRESSDRSKAALSVSAPGVRCDTRYTICDMSHPSEDRGYDFSEGDEVVIKIRLCYFQCPQLQTLFDRFSEIRKDMTGETVRVNSVPFSKTWEISEAKYNSTNWVEEYGYYKVGVEEGVHSDWQTGWVGGMMVTHAFLAEGSPASRERALRNFDFLFHGGQAPSGFFHGCGHRGKWYGDYFRDLERNWHLTRKSADTLYFLLKQVLLLEKQGESMKIKESWKNGIRRCADAFVKLWETYGQFGQFVDSNTGDMMVGGSACAAIAPAALALAGQYFAEERYLKAARESAQFYYSRFTARGYSNGGPGEICQCPDSESAFGLLESYIVLYEVTESRHWLDQAVAQANQCLTWCVSYDFTFPAESTFGKLDMHTAGSVYANVQNKHSAPGICTLSGDSLFKLYRATKDIKYLELIREIAHNLPQYLSREDRPIRAWNNNIGVGDGSWKDMPSGWMSERVNMSDWLEPIGEIFYGSCWCEVSNMLTYTEIPGLYVQPDTGFVYAIDHVDAEMVENHGDRMVVKVHNPTKFKAAVKVFSENSIQMSNRMGQNGLWGCREVEIDPCSEVELEFRK